MAAEDKRVYMLTPKGNAELTGANTSLSVADLNLLVMIAAPRSTARSAPSSSACSRRSGTSLAPSEE